MRAALLSAAACCGGRAAAAAACVESPTREFGPFYKPGQPRKSVVCPDDPRAREHGWAVASSLFARGWVAGRQALVVEGVVRNASDCAPVAGAEIDVWQSHQFGPYGSLHPGVEDGFCRAVVTSAGDGSFRFETHQPGSYGALGGHSVLGPAFDVPPFIDRHIHLAVWAGGSPVLVTQILWEDDPLLQSGVRAAPHGYDGAGVVSTPRRGADGVWRLSGVELTLPAPGGTPAAVHATREAAVAAHCAVSAGDMLVPALCMPGVARWVSPQYLYFLLLPAVIYVYIPAMLACVALCVARALRGGEVKKKLH